MWRSQLQDDSSSVWKNVIVASKQTWLLLSYQYSRYSKDDWGSMKRLERWCSRPATFSIFFTHMWYELIKVINTRQINLISFTKHSPVQGLCHALIEEAMSARETSNPIGTRATAADLCCNWTQGATCCLQKSQHSRNKAHQNTQKSLRVWEFRVTIQIVNSMESSWWFAASSVSQLLPAS